MTEITRDTTSKIPAFQKQYTLDGSAYIIRLTYNKRDDSWYMSIFTPELVTILSPIRLVSKIFLLRGKRALPNIPAGDFKVVQKSSDNAADITFDNFGTEFRLYYYDADEVTY